MTELKVYWISCSYLMTSFAIDIYRQVINIYEENQANVVLLVGLLKFNMATGSCFDFNWINWFRS